MSVNTFMCVGFQETRKRLMISMINRHDNPQLIAREPQVVLQQYVDTLHSLGREFIYSSSILPKSLVLSLVPSLRN